MHLLKETVVNTIILKIKIISNLDNNLQDNNKIMLVEAHLKQDLLLTRLIQGIIWVINPIKLFN